jgi:hypothetical protein
MATSVSIQRRFNTGDEPEYNPADISRQERLASCGEYYEITDMHGRPKKQRTDCKCQECPRCGGKRALEYRQQMLDALRGHKVVVSVLPHDDATSIIRGLSGRISESQYRHYVTSSGLDTVFVDASAIILVAKLPNPKPVTSKVVKAMDWFTLQNTKPNNRISGTLGVQHKLVTSKTDEKRVRVSTTGIIYTNQVVQSILIHEAQMRALAITLECDPKTLEEITYYMKMRQQAKLDILDELGVSYRTNRAYNSDYISSVDWVVDNYDDMVQAVEEGYVKKDRLDYLLSTLSCERLERIGFLQSIKPPPLEYYEYTNGPPI